MADQLKTTPRSWGPERRFAYVRWAPSGSASQTLTEAKGVTSVTRTAAGAYTIQLQDTKVKDLECFVGAIDNGAGTSAVRVESVSLTAGTIAVSHKANAGPVVVPMSHMTDLATTETIYGVSPVAGTITLIQTQVTGGGATDGAATVTFNINGTPITTGVVTVASGAVVGEVDSASPTAANTVAVGDSITGVSNGGGTTTTALDAVVLVQPAGSDTVDQLQAIISYRVVD